jgi:hypothetical protein
MTEPIYYVKKVRRNDDGQITKVKTSKTLEGRPKKNKKRKKVVKHVKKGKDVRTAYLKDVQWTAGDKLKLHDGKWLRTEGNSEERDNLGSLKSF